MMSADEKKRQPTRLENMAAYGLPHPWLWALVPAAAWAVLYFMRASVTESVYTALQSTVVLPLAFSVFGACLRLFGVRPAPRTRRTWSDLFHERQAKEPDRDRDGD